MALAAWCFQCGLEYDPEVAECVECGVPTVEHFPVPAHEVGGPEDEQLAYELHSWSGVLRSRVSETLYKANIDHGWQGPTLIALVDDEDAVDEILEDLGADEDADAGPHRSEDGQVALDTGGKDSPLAQDLLAELDELEIEYELLGTGFLLVPVAHEDKITEIFERLQTKHRGADTFGPGVEGVQALDVVEALFLSASTLRRSTRDLKASRELIEAADLAGQLQLPFGFEAPMWRGVLTTSSELAELIEDRGDDDEVEATAELLRNMLRNYV